jgi:4-amino-4-deoxy-L-arabinose transferase-like glycosyltransferase
MVFFLTRHWFGSVAARWAAELLAFNEYYLGVSGRATAHVPHLLFTAAAVYAFGRFLGTERAVYLYATGVALGVAFYSKEHAALLVPIFFVMLLHARYRHWFRSPHTYLAVVLFALVIGPDLLWNLRAREGLPQATYSDHLQRIGGLGVSPYPFMFYARQQVQWLHTRVTGRPVVDPAPEYRSMNSGLGALLLGAVIAATSRSAAPESGRFLLFLFWGVFGFFASIRPGGSPKDLDPASWIWVDVTLLPTVMLAGVLLAGARGRLRIAAWTFACAAMIYAAAGVLG